MKHISKFTLFLTLSLLFTACGNSAEGTYSVQTPKTGIFSADYGLYENGIVYESSDCSTAYFLDFASMESTPLCNKPNCTHKDSDCLAHIVTGDNNRTPPVVYQDCAYYFTQEQQIVEDGTQTKNQIHSCLMKADLHTGTITKILEFTDLEAVFNANVILEEKNLYFIAENGSISFDDGGWSYSANSGPQYLCRINLENPALENLGQVNSENDIDTTFFVEDGCSYSVHGEVQIDGVYDGNIYMHYDYADSKDTVLETIESGASEDTIPWNYRNFCYSLKDNTLLESDIPYASNIGDGQYLYEAENQFYLASDNDTCLQNITANTIFQPRIVNGKIFNSFTSPLKAYDIASQKMDDILTEQYNTNNTEVICYYDGSYIVKYIDENAEIAFDKVAENALLR